MVGPIGNYLLMDGFWMNGKIGWWVPLYRLMCWMG